MRTVSVAEAKAKLSELLGQVAHRGERVIVQRRGKPVAALVPLEDLERIGGEQGDWIDATIRLGADYPELADSIDEVVAERQTQMPRETRFWWDEKEE